MKILFIEDDEKVGAMIRPLLETGASADVDELRSMQAAIELMEGPWESADLIVCDYHGPSKALIKCVVALGQGIPVIFVIDENMSLQSLKLGATPGVIEAVDRQFLSRELLLKVKELETAGKIKSGKKDELDAAKKEQMSSQGGLLDAMLANPNAKPEEARAAAAETLELIHDVTEKLGFTAEVRALATKNVELTLKALGNKPRLSAITDNLKKHEGKYITSHSIMLAEICCAIACRVGWNSTPTYFKLTLASYLHDMPLKDNELARCRSLDEAKKAKNINQEGLIAFKLHPSRAAEYARKFHEIPPDVDTIISQHHELSDGTGFPRGLFQGQLTPLSCLFIIAEDMLHFFLDKEGDTVGSISEFVQVRGEYYNAGVFKKIIRALAAPEPPK